MESRVEDLHNDLQRIHFSCYGKYFASSKKPDSINMSMNKQTKLVDHPGLNSEAKIRRNRGDRSLTIRKQPQTENNRPITHRISTGSIPNKLLQFIGHGPPSLASKTPSPSTLLGEAHHKMDTSSIWTPPSSPNVSAEKHILSSEEHHEHTTYHHSKPWSSHSEGIIPNTIFENHEDSTVCVNASKFSTKVFPISKTAFLPGISSIDESHSLTRKSSTSVRDSCKRESNTMIKGTWYHDV